MSKTYQELMTLKSFEERFEYLKCCSKIGDPTFGPLRYLIKSLYDSSDWNIFRRNIFIRDNGCDLAHDGHPIFDLLKCSDNEWRQMASFTVHHIEPLTPEDYLNRSSKIFDPNNVITMKNSTHKAIHYGNINSIPTTIVERTPFDTCPWKR